MGSLGLQKLHGAIRRYVELERQCADLEIIVVARQHALHEEVAGYKFVPRHPGSIDSQYPHDWGVFINLGHVAALTGLSVAVVAVEPFLVEHLLGESADRFAVRSVCGGDECMTART